MKKFKRIRRIFAWIGIVVLVGLYVTTLILAFSGSPMAQALFRGSFAATVVFPVLLYAMQIIYRILKPDDPADDPDKKKRCPYPGRGASSPAPRRGSCRDRCPARWRW